MKTTRLYLALIVCLLFAGAVRAQVKIGDNPLMVGDNRVWEAEKADTLVILTDALEWGRTVNKTTNATGDAIMMKLFGYGLGQFNTVPQSYFLGTDLQGRMVEFPLTFDLLTNSSTATLSLNNGISNFISVDLTALDSVFSTNTQLTNAITTLETQINDSQAADGDTLTGNEWINLMQVTELADSLILEITENITGVGPTHTTRVELGYAVSIYLQDTFQQIRNEIADTAEALRNGTFYKADGFFDEDRTVTGAGHSLSYVGVDSLTFSNANFTLNTTGTTDVTSGGDVSVTSTAGDVDVSGVNLSTTSTGTTDVTSGGDVSVTSTAGDVDVSGVNLSTTSTGTTDVTSGGNVSVTSTTGDITVQATSGVVNISGDSLILSGPISNNSYGTGTNTGAEAYILAVDAAGNFIEVDIAAIGGDATLSSPVDLDEDGTYETTVDEAIQALAREIDSTIYNYDGTLQANRYMTMATRNLYFVDGADTTVITSDGRMAIGRGTVTNALMPGREIKLDVNGDILAMQIHSSSDERFKKNIVKVEGALEKVMAINGVTYDFRIEEFKDRNFPDSKQLGFIAQNVESVMPEVVKTNGDGFKAVDYAKLTALLNEAIKEQQLQIQDQSMTISKQQAMIDAVLHQNVQLTTDIKEIKSLLLTKSAATQVSEE